MQLLSFEDHGALLKLLFHCDSKTFTAIHLDFSNTFTTYGARFRACCATLLLLEDSRALSTAQRLGSWYLIYAGSTPSSCTADDANGKPLQCSASSNSTAAEPQQGVAVHNAFASYLLEVAEDSRRSAVERSLVLQLLQNKNLYEFDSRTPLDYALSYSLPIADASDSSALSQLRARLQEGSIPSTEQELDDKLEAKRRQLVAMAVPAATTSSTSNTSNTAVTSTALLHLSNGLHKQVGSSAAGASASSDASTTPTTPASSRQALSSSALLPSMLHSNATLSPANGFSDAADECSRAATVLVPSSATINERLQTVKELMERALCGPLLPSQQQTVLSALAQDTHVLSKCGITPLHLPVLVEHTPAIAAELLLRMNHDPALLNEYLNVLAHSEMSLHSMEVVNRLTTCQEVPTEFLHLYVTNCIHSCESTQDKYVQSRLVRLLCVFLQSLIRNRTIHIADLLHEVQSFCVNFSRIREAAKLFRLLKQMETGGRLLAVGDSPGSPTGGAGNGNHHGAQSSDSLSSVATATAIAG